MNENISKVIKNPYFIPAVTGFATFGIGIGVGYILNKKIKPKSIDKTPENYDTMEKFTSLFKNKLIDEGYNPMDIDENIINELGVTEIIPIEEVVEETILIEEVVEELIPKSIFAGSEDDEDWDYAFELENRDEELPYIIHKDEFYSDERGYSQLTLVYYSGDDIMVDEDDSPIYNHVTVVGELKFGHGSSDPNVFYVRNNKREAEYEILFDTGLYSVEVLGLDIEDNQRSKDLKHAYTKKFKSDE